MQIFYTVKPGDTLSSIAQRWLIPPNSLILANNIAAPYVIYPDQQLSMPPGVTTYSVKPGDTIFSISQSYGVPMNIIIQANTLEPPYLIIPGMVLNVPEGVPFYVVRYGDSLYNIAKRYNVTVDGQVRPDLIINANSGLTPDIVPGMTLAIPYPPPGGTGRLAVLLNDGLNNYIGLYDPSNGKMGSTVIVESDRASNIFWSPDRRYIAHISGSGIISVIGSSTGSIVKIDQINLPGFADWLHDSNNLVYSTGRVIRYYDVSKHTFKSVNRSGALYVQYFPGDKELLYEASDPAGISQLYRSNIDGTNERKLTNNSNWPLNEVRLSPDGRYALYTSPGASISEIYTLELSTGAIINIPGGPEAKNYYPVWSPDSTKIAFSATFYKNGKYYNQIRVSTIKSESSSVLAISSCYATPVTWSADGSKLAFLSGCRADKPPVEVWSISLAKPFPINILSGFLFYNLDWS